MAVRFDAGADFLKRVGSVPNLIVPVATDVTICGWIKRKVDTGAFATALYYEGGGQHEVFIETDTGGDVLTAAETKPGPEIDLTGPTLTNNVWVFVLSTRTNTSRTLYWGTEAGGTLSTATDSSTRTVTSTGIDNIWIGNDPFTEPFNGEVSLVRLFPSSFSAAEADAEWRSLTPVKPGVRCDYRLASAATATTDSSGNGFTLTVGGTLADGGADPVPPVAGTKLILIPGR